MADDEKLLSQADIDALTSQVPTKPRKTSNQTISRETKAASKREPDLPKPEVPSKPAHLKVEVASGPSPYSREIETLKKMVDDLKKQVLKDQTQLEQISQYIHNKPIWNPQDTFQCSNCKSTKFVAIHVKCTSCDKTHWIGWWPKQV
jgi:hypothetical protein